MAKKDDASPESLGRNAEAPHQIPRKGWKDVLLRVKSEASHDNLSLIAAGISYYGIFALFPLLIAMVSIFGLVADPHMVEEQLQNVAGVIPSEARSIIFDQMSGLINASKAGLSVSAAVSIVVALWSASTGTSALIQGINICYGEDETRGFIKLRGLSLLITLGLIIFTSVAIAFIAVVPSALDFVGLNTVAGTAIKWGRWPLLAICVIAGLAVLNRYAPDREEPKWRWVTAGSFITTVLWLVISGAFSYYAGNFGKYNETYGSIAGVVVLLLWFYMSAYVVLLGAELNAELEHQTAVDSTSGAPKPMGERGAKMADTLPGSETKDESERDRSHAKEDIDLRSGA